MVSLFGMFPTWFVLKLVFSWGDSFLVALPWELCSLTALIPLGLEVGLLLCLLLLVLPDLSTFLIKTPQVLNSWPPFFFLVIVICILSCHSISLLEDFTWLLSSDAPDSYATVYNIQASQFLLPPLSIKLTFSTLAIQTHVCTTDQSWSCGMSWMNSWAEKLISQPSLPTSAA